MNMGETNNPYAYPWSSATFDGYIGQAGCNEGMTLLDYFAGQCLSGFVANKEWVVAMRSVHGAGAEFERALARCSYEVAEQMLLARTEFLERVK